MIGAARQTLRCGSRARRYHQIGSQLLRASQPCPNAALPMRAAASVLEHQRLGSLDLDLRRWLGTSAAQEAFKGETPSAAPAVKNYVGGELVESQASEHIDVINPATQAVVSRVPLTTHAEFESAVAVAKEAFKSWKKTPVTARQRVMLKLQELIRRDMDKLALSVTTEQGKTLADARGDVFRGLEVTHLCL